MGFARLSFNVTGAGEQPHGVELEVSALVMTGWAGRDRRALQAHIDELAELGVSPPGEVPCFYRVAANQVTTGSLIQVVGDGTSGEVEFVIVSQGGELWIGSGSDETDRRLEAHSVAASKQICAKSIAPTLWRYSDVAGHWDELRLRSWITAQGVRRLYQDRPVSDLLPPDDLIRRFSGAHESLPSGTVLFGGTCQVIGRIGGGSRFEYELEDPVLSRRIGHGYDLQTLPMVQ
jgi:hypothetical protein